MVKFNKDDYKRLEEIASRCEVVQPFVDDNLEKQAKRIRQVLGSRFEVQGNKPNEPQTSNHEPQRSWSSFDFFAKTYFPHVVDLEFCNIHRYMFNIVEKSSGVTGITGFRGLGKSAIFGFIYPIWKIIRGEKYVIYGGATETEANEKADFIKHEFENNRRLLKDFPFLKIKDTDENVFFLQNDTKIRAVSINQKIRGTMNTRNAKRPGLIVLDDIDDETNVGNMTVGKRKKDRIAGEIRGSLQAGYGKVLWLGNLTHPNFAICQFKAQIINEIKENKDNVNDDVLCLHGKEKRLIQISLERNGKSLWEAQYPTESLPALREDYGMVGYQREMLGKSLIDGVIFKANWFSSGTMPPDKDFKEIWLYIDPAWGQKGCYKSIFAVGYNGYKYFVIKAWCRQCENSKMFEYLHDVFHELRSRFGARVRFSYEANFNQSRIMTDFDNWILSGASPVTTSRILQGTISHHFQKVINRENKNLRIEGLEPVIESGKIVFPEGQDMPTVIGQFTSYPQGYIDACDALAGCMERFGGYGQRKGFRVRRLNYAK